MQPELPLEMPKIPVYKTKWCVIVWIDILGFASLLAGVEASDKNATHKFARLEYFLQSEVLNGVFPWKYESQLFSDTLVLTVPVPKDPELASGFFYRLPFEIGILQCKFLEAGFPIRGAVTGGRAISAKRLKSSLMYAHLDRYEKEYAIVPRILYGLGEVDFRELADEHFDASVGAGLPGFDWPIATATDDDGRTFIDYMVCCGIGYKSGDEFVTTHKKLIETSLAEAGSNSRIKGKYQWMAQYHNRVIASEWFDEHFVELSNDEAHEFLIPSHSIERFEPKSVFPELSEDGSFYFNWDRENPYRHI